MQSLQLYAALTELAEAASGQLAAAVAAGAEVPFELESQRARRGSYGAAGGPSTPGATFYAYRALTGEFITQRRAELERLPCHAQAVALLEGFDGLERYLANIGGDPVRGDVRARARAAVLAVLREVFDEQSDFELRPERLRSALERLERSALAGAGQTTLVATLHGLTIASPELQLAKGLTIAQPDVLDEVPEGARDPEEGGPHEHLIVALSIADEEPHEAIARGRDVLKDLLRALRLFGDGRVTLGALAWARVGDGRWSALSLGTGGRPHGMLLVTAEQEDELRAFCNLVSRRAPHGNELAWALRRFELGSERESSFEALSDHLLALRVLLEPEGPASGTLPGRLAALCATPERRVEFTQRVLAALALERDVVAGVAVAHSGLQELAREMADHLRALLRDVICGHLDPNLVGLADQLLLEPVPVPDDLVADAGHVAAEPIHAASEQGSLEEMLADASQPQEILDVFI